MRLLAIGLAIAVIVFALTAGHVVFLPLLFLPFGLFSFGHRRRRESADRAEAWRRGGALMWLFGRGFFRPFGPLGLALLAYRIWRRLSPARKAELKSRARQVSRRLQGAASR